MNLRENIESLFKIIEDLQSNYPNKMFTLDGRLVGDIGEILVQENYDVKLYSKLKRKYDGLDSFNRKIQIKSTFKDSLSFPCDRNEVPDYFIGIKINRDGSFEEIYNGKGADIWNLVKNRKKTKISSFKISLSTLKKINENEDPFDRIERKDDMQNISSGGASWYISGSRKTSNYLKIIDMSMITEKIIRKYKKDFDYCNLSKEDLYDKYYDRNGFIYFKAEKYYRFALQIKELASK